MLPKGNYTLDELAEMKSKLEEEIIERRELIKEIEKKKQVMLMTERVNKAVESMSDEEKAIMATSIGGPNRTGDIQ